MKEKAYYFADLKELQIWFYFMVQEYPSALFNSKILHNLHKDLVKRQKWEYVKESRLTLYSCLN